MKKKRIETSKRIVLFNDTLMTLVLICLAVAVFLDKDISGFTEIAVALIGLATAGHGFYFWKAKAENLHKYGQEEKITMNDNDLPM